MDLNIYSLERNPRLKLKKSRDMHQNYLCDFHFREATNIPVARDGSQRDNFGESLETFLSAVECRVTVVGFFLGFKILFYMSCKSKF
jgi:hypothetical protein